MMSVVANIVVKESWVFVHERFLHGWFEHLNTFILGCSWKRVICF